MLDKDKDVLFCHSAARHPKGCRVFVCALPFKDAFGWVCGGYHGVVVLGVGM